MARLRRWLIAVAAIAIVFSAYSVPSAMAARPTSLKDTLSDSRSSTAATHTVVLVMGGSTTFDTTDTITVAFPSGFNMSSLASNNVTFNDGTARSVLASCSAGVNNISYVLSSQTATFTACSTFTSSAAGATVTMTFGSSTATITNNATPGNYTVTVAGTYGDSSQDAQIVVIGGVTMSATIAQTLTDTTAGVTTANCPDVTSITQTEVDTSSDATTVPFGTISNNTFYGACQKVTVSTNAQNGYSTTIQTTSLPTSGSNTIAKGTCDSSCSDTVGAAWATNTNYGYGYCMSDSSGTPAATADSTNWSSTHQCGGATPYHKTIPNAGSSQVAQVIMKASSGANANAAYIRYEMAVGPTQAAGSYSTILVYVTTPTF